MPNTELPMDLESQVVLMKKYITFRQRKKMREFLGYAGYFRASRYVKFLLHNSMRLEVRRIQKFSLNYMILMCN